MHFIHFLFFQGPYINYSIVAREPQSKHHIPQQGSA